MADEQRELVPIDPPSPRDMLPTKPPANVPQTPENILAERELTHLDPYRQAVVQAAESGIELPPDSITATAASLMHDRWAHANSVLTVRSPGTAAGVGLQNVHSGVSAAAAVSIEVALAGLAFGPLIAAEKLAAPLVVFGATILTALIGSSVAKRRYIFIGASVIWSATTGYIFSNNPIVETYGQNIIASPASVAPQQYAELKEKQSQRVTFKGFIDQADASLVNAREQDAKVAAQGGTRRQLNAGTTFSRTNATATATHAKYDPQIAALDSDIAGLNVDIDQKMANDPSRVKAQYSAWAFYTVAMMLATYYLGRTLGAFDPKHQETLEIKRKLHVIRTERDALSRSPERRKVFAMHVLSNLQNIYVKVLSDVAVNEGVPEDRAKKDAAQRTNEVFANLSGLAAAAAESFNNMLVESKDSKDSVPTRRLLIFGRRQPSNAEPT